MSVRACLLALLAALPALGGDWNPKLAAQYLDSRQKLWIVWPRATKSGVACLSCHTSLPYLLARPALRRALGEGSATAYETALLDGVRAKLDKASGPELFPDLKTSLLADQIFGANTVLAALVLALDDAGAGRALSRESERALARMWSTQLRSGAAKGAWLWTDVDLDPWETGDSAFYGAALAAVATGSAPGGYQSRPQIRENVALLTAYLRDAQREQPLHNRLLWLWAGHELRDCLPEPERQAILSELRERQGPDGGWTLESLGRWKAHTAAPASSGSNAYATAVAAFALREAGLAPTDAVLAQALRWLRAHQDPESGYWDAQSMNKRYDAGSMQIQFMRDAATAYSAAALLDRKTH